MRSIGTDSEMTMLILDLYEKIAKAVTLEVKNIFL